MYVPHVITSYKWDTEMYVQDILLSYNQSYITSYNQSKQITPALHNKILDIIN